jgi:hypothetical protein
MVCRVADWQIDAHHLRLRAERAGKGNDRTYTITINSTERRWKFIERIG